MSTLQEKESIEAITVDTLPANMNGAGIDDAEVGDEGKGVLKDFWAFIKYLLCIRRVEEELSNVSDDLVPDIASMPGFDINATEVIRPDKIAGVGVIESGCDFNNLTNQQNKEKLLNISGGWKNFLEELDEVRNFFFPITLAFLNLKFSVKEKIKREGTKEKIILYPLSGLFSPGTVVGIMGPSGCGKTTLLDILANKKTAKYTGDVFVNGKYRNKFFKRASIYVSQEDIYNGNEYVHEVLEFSAKLKSSMDKTLRLKAVHLALKALGLEKIANSRVGNSTIRGISGGQKRRLTLGKALMTDSLLAFCDEPTSGLSSSDSEIVLTGIRNLAKLFKVSYIIVIHQPRLEVFEKFDHIVLLSAGRCIYNGPREEIQAHFAKLGYHVPPHVNPADYYIDMITPGYPGSKPEELADYYDANVKPIIQKRVEDSLLKVYPSVSGHSLRLEGGSHDKIYVTDRLTQFLELFKRNVRLLWRDKDASFLVLFNAVAMAVVTGLMFYDVYKKKAINYQISAHLLVAVAISVLPLVNVSSYLDQRVQYVYETSDGYYSPVPYLISQMLTGSILLLMGITSALIILWGLCGFPFNTFLPCLLLYILFLLTMDAYMSFAAIASSSYQMANSVAALIVGIFSVLNGFNANPRTIPKWLGWMVYISPYFYLLEGVCISLYYQNTDVFGSVRKMYKFGFKSDDMLFDSFGYVGKAFNCEMNARDWLWFVDVPVLAGMLVSVRLIMSVYQTFCVQLKR